MSNLFDDLATQFGTLSAPILAGFLTVVAFQMIYFVARSRRDFAVSYRISVLGLPRSGKTALIAAMFDHIFSSQSSSNFSPVGQQTINRINKQIACLDSRRGLGPTKEDDIFIFRFLYYVRRIFVLGRIRYEGEVVDFPGEMSENLLKSAEDGSLEDDIALFHKEFYSWIISSKSHIFVIDLARHLLNFGTNDFVSERTAEIRAAWQLLNEEIGKAQRSNERRVALVFSKFDLAHVFFSESVAAGNREKYLNHFGYVEPPKMGDVAKVESGSDFVSEYINFQYFIKDEYSQLIDYFKNQNCDFSVFFTSAYADSRGQRIGIHDLVKFVLPKGNLASH